MIRDNNKATPRKNAFIFADWRFTLTFFAEITLGFVAIDCISKLRMSIHDVLVLILRDAWLPFVLCACLYSLARPWKSMDEQHTLDANEHRR